LKAIELQSLREHDAFGTSDVQIIEDNSVEQVIEIKGKLPAQQNQGFRLQRQQSRMLRKQHVNLEIDDILTSQVSHRSSRISDLAKQSIVAKPPKS